MISCIVCSRDKDISLQLKKNISDTIGVEYELVIIDNSSSQYDIFTAYNEGISRSKGDILCFMHDDIIFHSNSWGGVVSSILQDATIGLVGVLGQMSLSPYSIGWGFNRFVCGKWIQGKTEGMHYHASMCSFGFKEGKSMDDVVLCDGLWMCIHKRCFERISFDVNHFRGFHFYDMDICMQLLDNDYRNVVTYDVLIEHRSPGFCDKSYHNNFCIWYEKWSHKLPIHRGDAYSFEHINDVNDLLGQIEFHREKNHRLIHSKEYIIGMMVFHPLRVIKFAIRKMVNF